MSKSLMLVPLAVAALVACQGIQPIDPEPGTNELIKIAPVITRATSTNFETGDKIGVDIIKGQSVYAGNACLTYSEADQSFAGDTKWYADGGESCVVKAFYPYSEAGFPSSFKVASDQTGGAGSSDFMVAAKTGVYPQREAVTMQFKHYLSQIVVKITNTASAEVEFVAIKNLVPEALVAVEGDVITVTPAEAEVAEIKCECLDPGLKYRAVVVPQESTLSMEIKVKNGNVLVTDIPESLLKQGYTYTINAELTPDNVNVSLSGEIENWEDGGELNGQQKAEVSFHEYLDEGYFEYDNVNYNVVKMKDGKWWMAQNLAFVPQGFTPSDDVNDVAAGVYYPVVYDAATSKAIFDKSAEAIMAQGYLYQTEVALGLKVNSLSSVSEAEALSGAQGICPKGWHVPTAADLIDLVGKGVSPLSNNTGAPYYNGSNGSIKMLNEDGFNIHPCGAVTITDNTKTSATLMGALSNYASLTSGYYCGSTYQSVSYNTSGDAASGIKNLQFAGLMPMTNKTSEADFTCNESKLSYKIGASLRCVRNGAE